MRGVGEQGAPQLAGAVERARCARARTSVSAQSGMGVLAPAATPAPLATSAITARANGAATIRFPLSTHDSRIDRPP